MVRRRNLTLVRLLDPAAHRHELVPGAAVGLHHQRRHLAEERGIGQGDAPADGRLLPHAETSDLWAPEVFLAGDGEGDGVSSTILADHLDAAGGSLPNDLLMSLNFT